MKIIYLNQINIIKNNLINLIMIMIKFINKIFKHKNNIIKYKNINIISKKIHIINLIKNINNITIINSLILMKINVNNQIKF